MTLTKKMEKEIREALKKTLEKPPWTTNNVDDNKSYRWTSNPPQPYTTVTTTGDSVTITPDPLQKIYNKLEAIEERLREIEKLPIINLLKEGARNDDDEE